jgi:predicted nucleic acid-binding protein
MKRIAVIDSSSLINLTHLGLANNLRSYFDRIYVPRQVQVEVNRKSRFRYRLKKLYDMGFFERCACADRYSIRLLGGELDLGEAEGLVQAREKEARFFIADDIRARKIAEHHELIPIGTVRILARLSLERFADDTRLLVRRLQRELHFRVSDSVVEQAISDAPKQFDPP